MPLKNSGTGSEFASLWFRLISIAIVALVFAEALLLASGKAQGWAYYLTAPEIAFEVVVRLIFGALAGVVAESGPPSKVLETPTNPRLQQFLHRILEPGVA